MLSVFCTYLSSSVSEGGGGVSVEPEASMLFFEDSTLIGLGNTLSIVGMTFTTL